MEHIYRAFGKFGLFFCLCFALDGHVLAQAPFTVTGTQINPSCYGLSNGSINLTVTGAGGGSSTGNYCSPIYSNPSCDCGTTQDFINNFSTSGGLTNISNLNSGCPTSPPNYSNYSSQTVTVDPGQTFGIQVQCAPQNTGCGNFSQGFRIWIDFNQDGDFADAGESVWNSGTSGPEMFSGNILVPANTTCGPKRMRVRCTYAGVPGQNDYCASYSYGETEDYTVQVCSPATFAWSNGATTEDISNLPAGSYTVTVTSSTNSSVVSFTLGQPSQVVTNITAAGNDTLLCTGETTVLTASGAPTWTYTWSTGATGKNLTAAQPGVYTVTVSNSNGCSATDQITVLSGTANPPTITPSGGTTFCEGSSITLTVNPANGIAWQPGGETTPTIIVSQSGAYSVTFTDVSGCTGQTEPVTMTVVAPPAPVITPDGPTAFCQGEILTLTSNYPTGNTWSNGATTQSISVTTSGSYGLTVSYTNCSGTAQPIDVNVSPAPTPQITADGPLAFCEGGSVTLSSNYTTGNAWSTGSAGSQIVASASASYTLTVTDANGCSALTGPMDVLVTPIPPVPVITPSGPTALCQGGSVTLSSSAASGNAWSNGSNATSIMVDATGTYGLTVTNGGCSNAAMPIDVSVNPLPTPQITPNGPTALCQGGAVTLTSNYNSGNAWSDGTLAAQVVVSTTASYYLTVTDANGCSDIAGPLDVTVSAAPTPPVITANGPVAVCEGDAVVLSSSYASGNQWSNNLTTNEISVTQTGAYTVTVTDVNGCSSASASFAVTVNPNPTAAFDIPLSGCLSDNATITYTGNGSAGAQYTWLFGDANVASGNGVGPYTLSFASAGAYPVSLQVTEPTTGCASPTVVQTIQVNENPTADFTLSAANVCVGDTLVATYTGTGSASSAFNWSFGSGTAIGSGAGPYALVFDMAGNTSATLTVVQNGCSSPPFALPVNVHALPDPHFNADKTAACDSLSAQFFPAALNAASYDWSFGDGATDNAATPLHAYTTGDYTVSLHVTDVNGCENGFTDTAMIQVYATPEAAFNSTPVLRDTLNLDEAAVTFDNTSVNGVAYDWNFGDGDSSVLHSPTHTYVASGNYAVQLVVANPLGCTDTAVSATFYVLPAPQTFVPTMFTPNGDGVNDQFKIYSYRYERAFFAVYDRSGEKVFETNDIENGWDGTLRGQRCNAGVYVYYVKLRFFNGEEKEFFGDVTLLR